MTTMDAPARVSLAPGATAAACELCTAEPASRAAPTMTVVIQHPRGGIVELAACDWCVQAIRRLSATTGGQAVFMMSHAAAPPPSALSGAPRGPRVSTMPALVSELSQEIEDTAGVRYIVRVYAHERIDGKWEAWLEFVAIGLALARRTAIETTQSTMHDVTYWASGLGASVPRGSIRAQSADHPHLREHVVAGCLVSGCGCQSEQVRELRDD